MLIAGEAGKIGPLTGSRGPPPDFPRGGPSYQAAARIDRREAGGDEVASQRLGLYNKSSSAFAVRQADAMPVGDVDAQRRRNYCRTASWRDANIFSRRDRDYFNALHEAEALSDYGTRRSRDEWTPRTRRIKTEVADPEDFQQS